MKCLGCRQKMVEKLEYTRRGPVYYDVCEACGGMWFDVGEMDAMVLQVFDSVEASSKDRARGISEPLRKCPRCGDQWMDKVFFLTYGNVLLDCCRTCHGFWLDGGEFDLVNKDLQELKESIDKSAPGPVGTFIMALLACVLQP